MIPLLRKTLLPAAIVAFAWAIVAAATGGVDARIAGLAIRARGPSRPLLIGFALLAAYAALNRDAFARLADRAGDLLVRAALPIAIVTAVIVCAMSVRFGTFTAGGSDSYGYVSEAYGWVNRELPGPIPLPVRLPSPTSDMMQIPLGYHQGPRPHTMVPTYAPGLPLLMGLGILLAGACGPFLVVPACAALLVWCTFLLARRVAGPTAGAIAAILIATTPVVLFQMMSPMSDVPAGAFWTAALAAALAVGSDPTTSLVVRFRTGTRRMRVMALLAGFCTAVGVLIRPNLLPLAVVPAVAAAVGQHGRERWVRVVCVFLPVTIAQAFLSFLHTTWYGSPFATGYGRAADLYALANIWPNIKLYATWFLQSESPWALVGLIALLPIARKQADARTLGICVLMLTLTVLAYLAYSTFEVWWYLRFLLPAGGAAATLVALGIITVARTVPAPWGRVAACATFAALVTATVSFASRASVFGGLRDGERHYIEVGEFVRRALPDNAAIFAVQHSGSLRFYGGRLTLRFDWIDREWASRATQDVERIGLHPYLVVDDFELPQVHSQFGLIPSLPLAYPVVARMRDLAGTTVFDLGSHVTMSPPIALEPGGARRCSGPGLPLRVW